MSTISPTVVSESACPTQTRSGLLKLTSATWTWNAQFESDIYYVEHVSFALDVWMVFKTIKILLTKSEMRTNSDRIKFDGKNLLETRPRHEIVAEMEQKATDKEDQ